MVSFEEMIVAVGTYPRGAFVYKHDVNGETYYHFENWTATEDMIRADFAKLIENGDWVL